MEYVERFAEICGGLPGVYESIETNPLIASRRGKALRLQPVQHGLGSQVPEHHVWTRAQITADRRAKRVRAAAEVDDYKPGTDLRTLDPLEAMGLR